MTGANAALPGHRGSPGGARGAAIATTATPAAAANRAAATGGKGGNGGGGGFACPLELCIRIPPGQGGRPATGPHQAAASAFGGTGGAGLSATLASAESFFGNNSLPLGSFASGTHSVSLENFLTYKSGTRATAGAGFGFTYDLAELVPSNLALASSPVPEASTWVMMLVGLARLGLGWLAAVEQRQEGSCMKIDPKPIFMRAYSTFSER